MNGPAEVWVERRGRLQRAVAALRRCRRAAGRLRAAGGPRRPAPRRRPADGRRPPRRRLAAERRAAAAGARRAAADAAPLRAAPVHARRAGRARLARREATPSCSTSACGRAWRSSSAAARRRARRRCWVRWRRASMPTERIVTVEDAAELRIDRPHVARLEARGANLEGSGEVGDPRARAQRAADAARPARRGRGARRRGARHAAGDDHRSRRVAHHRPCEEPRTMRSGASSCWR